MTLLQRTINMFEDNSEIGSLKQDFLLLYAECEKTKRSADKVRRGIFAEVGELKKENAALKQELEEIKKHLNLEKPHEKSYSDLPIFCHISASVGSTTVLQQ